MTCGKPTSSSKGSTEGAGLTETSQCSKQNCSTGVVDTGNGTGGGGMKPERCTISLKSQKQEATDSIQTVSGWRVIKSSENGENGHFPGPIGIDFLLLENRT